MARLMAAAGSGAGFGTSTGLEATTLQKLALRRKKVLGTEEMELYELALAAGAAIDPDVFKNRGGPTLGSVPIVAERGSREGPIQRMPRQPSATRLPKAGPGKSNTRSST
ncbi:Mzt2 [Phodopus roborovskii]|uniref:Mzt2 protein n=1 Tax=Phodopus roborovskii TaxID=109678 RepID=A0AAU9ZIT2_PHORO|nr:Mzt2 [Phodopus roborovskii]